MSLVISIVKLLTIESALDEKHRKEGRGCKCVNSNKKKQENKNYFFSHHNMLPLTMISYILSPFPRKGKQKFYFCFRASQDNAKVCDEQRTMNNNDEK